MTICNKGQLFISVTTGWRYH